jgi:tetratricopeptide (TPR) repeat protein
VVNLFRGVDARILRGVLGEGFSPSLNAFDLNERGVTSYRQGQYPEALNYYQHALVIYREVENRAGEGITLNNIGDVYRARGQYDQALNYCQQGLVIARDVRNGALEEVVLADMRKVQSSSTPPLVSFIKAIGRSRNRR